MILDPNDANRIYMSWLRLGLRAFEWRPGHLHTNAFGEGWLSWNIHEVGRSICVGPVVENLALFRIQP
jgi:hypothetical protein